MNISDAFLGAYERPKHRLKKAAIPNIVTKNYDLYPVGEWSRDTEILHLWLVQQGLSESDIAQKTYREWSRVKTTYWDHNVLPPQLERIPKSRAQWVEMSELYGIPAEQRDSLKEAWQEFSEHSYIDDGAIGATITSVRRGGEEINGVFDRFVHSWQENGRVSTGIDEIYIDMYALEERLRHWMLLAGPSCALHSTPWMTTSATTILDSLRWAALEHSSTK